MIEKAFRISKTDLRVRPIYHLLKHWIEAHICVVFCTYKIYKELERQLKEKQYELSAEKTIYILKTINASTIKNPYSQNKATWLLLKKDEQKVLLKLFEI